MNHILAGCGQGVSESCTKYATESWSGGGVLLGLVILAVIVLVCKVVFFRKRE